MAPRYGHLEALKQVFEYLRRMPHGRILIDTSQPDVRKTAVVTKGQNWVEFYPDACEDVPHDMLTPKGGLSTLTCYVDADHARDKLTRRSVTVLYFSLIIPLLFGCPKGRKPSSSLHLALLWI